MLNASCRKLSSGGLTEQIQGEHMKDPFTMAPSIGARVVVGLLLGLRVKKGGDLARRLG